MSERPPEFPVKESASVIDLEVVRMRALRNGIQEVGVSWQDWEKLGKDLLAHHKLLHQSFVQMEERADPTERKKRTRVLSDLIETWSFMLQYAIRTRLRSDAHMDTELVKIMDEKINGPEPKEHDHSFADLCRRAGISPFIRGMLTTDQCQSLLENYNDAKNTKDIREAIATEAVIATMQQGSPVGDVAGFVEQYMRLVHLLDGYPTHDDMGETLYGFDDIGPEEEDVLAVKALLEKNILGKYPSILVD